MSINVTVHGNPVRINRGKMVTYDTDSEFERRRRIRLQQVREQSKEIAADVRNRVRKEKEKYLSCCEKQGEEDLKRWQARKLLALQQQYRDCIKEVGSAHTNAALERNPDEVLAERAATNQAIANYRNKLATEKQKIEDDERKTELAASSERKKYARRIEDTRSTLVTNLKAGKSPGKKKKRKKMKKAESEGFTESDTSPTSESDIENLKPDTPNAPPPSQKSKSGGTKKCKTKGSRKKSPKKHKSAPVIPTASSESSQVTSTTPGSHGSDVSSLKSPVVIEKNQLHEVESASQLSPSQIKELIEQHRPVGFYSSDTRISDKIRNRKLFGKEFDESSYEKQNNFQFISNDVRPDKSPPSKRKQDKFQIESYQICNIKCREKKKNLEGTSPQPDSPKKRRGGQKKTQTNYICNIKCKKAQKKAAITHSDSSIDTDSAPDIKDKKDEEKIQSALPYVPTTSLRPSINHIDKSCQTNKVKYYDRFTHFSNEYIGQPVVQKISKDNIEIHPESDRLEEEEFQERSQRQGRAAQTRGAKALEKTRIQNEYKQLLEELPVLQRQERLAAMRTHRPTHHMSDDRLKDLERLRQNRIENIFEKYYQKCKNLDTPLITIKPVQKSPPADDLKLPFKTLDVTDSPEQLNVAEWKPEDAGPSEEVPRDPLQQASPRPSKTASLEPSQKASPSQPEEQLQEDDLREKQKTLIDLLQRVNRQRELLLQEVATLPLSSNLHKILEDEEILKAVRARSKSPKKQEKTLVSTATSPLTTRSPKAQVKSSPVKMKENPKRAVVKTKESSKRAAVFTSSSDTSTEGAKKQRKKTKVKKQKVLIKNEQTQTSPLSVTEFTKDAEESPPVPVETSRKFAKDSVDRGREEKSENMCEIIIKMSEESSIKISTTSPTRASEKEFVCTKVAAKKQQHKSVAVDIQHEESKSQSVNTRPLSNDISTSTTYMSPPDVEKPAASVKQGKQTHLYKDLLHSKPQQTNVDMLKKKTEPGAICSDPCRIKRREINQHLLKYIKKLLSMSRQSVDEMTVSSVSEVSTPGTSVIETDTNSPILQLHSVLKHYNLSVAEVQKLLVSTSGSSAHSDQTDTSKELQTAAKTSEDPNVTDEVSEAQKPKRKMAKTDLESRADIPAFLDFKCKDLLEMPYCSILARYKELTESCCKKISNLTAMIDRVRSEKEKLMSPLSSDKNEHSTTSYMELPHKNSSDNADEGKILKKSTEENSSNSSSSCSIGSISQDVIDRYLLAINNTSTSSSPECSSKCPKKNQGRVSRSEPNISQGKDRLTQESSASTSSKAESDSGRPAKKNKSPQKCSTTNGESVQATEPEIQDEDDFVPMLSGIPKYGEVDQEDAIVQTCLLDPRVQQMLLGIKPKPPPSLLRNATRFNMNIDMTPHELSTIVEIDTIASSRNISEVAVTRPLSPEEKVPSRDRSPKAPDTQPMKDPEQISKCKQCCLSKQDTKKGKEPEKTTRDSLPKSEKAKISSPKKMPCCCAQKRKKSPKREVPAIIASSPKDTTTVSKPARKESRSEAPESGASTIKVSSPKNTTAVYRPVENESENEAPKSGASTTKVSSPEKTTGVSKPTGKEPKRESLKSQSSPEEDVKHDLPVSKSEVSGVKKLLVSDSSSSPEDMEAMLRNMGLGWAISTLKKTHEALALSSSSSASDPSYKKHVSFRDSSSSNSDVSLKEVLSREFLRKITSTSVVTESSTSKSLDSPQILELQDVSHIAGVTEFHSRDKSQQRTSTPVLQSKSTDSKNLFTGDSDLSSVKQNSDENLFLSVPNVSLDTSRSLSKTKQ